MSKKIILTEAGLKQYQDELTHLKVERRRDIAEKIKEAREHGDLSENAEYSAAKDEQRDIEARIEELEELLNNVEIVTDSEVRDDEVSIGCTVEVLDIELNKKMEFRMVGSHEANSLKGKISNESPLGAALMGHRVGDTVVNKAPIGDLEFKILNISKQNIA